MEEAQYILAQIHKGVYGNHFDGGTLARKLVRWDTIGHMLSKKQKNLSKSAQKYSFLWKVMVCRFGIPYSIILNNG